MGAEGQWGLLVTHCVPSALPKAGIPKPQPTILLGNPAEPSTSAKQGNSQSWFSSRSSEAGARGVREG